MAVPTTEQLVLAVKQFLETDVIPQLAHRTAFHARVAANVLSIVARDLTSKPELVEQDMFNKHLAQPSDTAAADLCARIRSGALSEKTDQLLDDLLTAAMARLAADNPKYSTYLRMTGQ